jgi:hypothetical protein
MIPKQAVAPISEPIGGLLAVWTGTNLCVERGDEPTPIEELEVLTHLTTTISSTDYTNEEAVSRAFTRSGIEAPQWSRVVVSSQIERYTPARPIANMSYQSTGHRIVSIGRGGEESRDV